MSVSRAQSPPESAVDEAVRNARFDAILRLYATRNDHLPAQSKRVDHASGFVHRAPARETCPDCFGETPARVGCETCSGRGYLEVRRSRDPYAVSKVQPYGITPATHERGRQVDAEIARLAAQTAPPPATAADEIAEANRRDYGWAEARKAMYRDFDYRALDVALEALHGALPGVAPTSDRGLAFLEPLMPDPIRAPSPTSPLVNLTARGNVDDRALKQRDRQLRRWVLVDEMPVQWVAWQAGLSVSQVYRIVDGEEAMA